MNTLGVLKQANGQTYQLNKRINIIGRANSCHVIVKHASSSKEHCLIEFDDRNNTYIKDMESLNGTYLNDQRLKSGQTVQIFDQDVIQVGQDQNRFTFIQPKSLNQQMRGNSQGEQAVIHDENPPRKDKDFKISVVDYSFRDNSFSRQPVRTSHSPHSATSPYINNGQKSQNQSIQQDAGFGGNNYNMRQQRADKVEGVKQELYNQNIDLNDKLLQKEETNIRMENEIKLLRNENDALIEENDKLKAKQKALLLYSSELQKQIDVLNDQNKQKTIQLAELSEQDWTRKLQENNVEIKNLRQILSQKDVEIYQLKKNIQNYFQNSKDLSQNNATLFLEHQAKELTACKKQVVEYENRNNECSKRWTSLLQENSDKDDKIKGLKLQLSRQIETMQSIYSENDRKINEYNNKLMRVFDDNDDGYKQKEAAEFLVQQVAFMQEERKNLAIENENLHTQIQELISEIEKMKQELENYAVLLDVSVMDLSSNKANQGNIISKLKNRVDELEDYVNETKQKESVSKLIELTELQEELEKKLDRERVINDELNKQLKTVQLNNKTEQINEQNCIEFFSNLLDEKDKKIQILLNQLEQFQIKEKQYNERIDDLNSNLMVTNKNFTDYKSKNDKISEIMSQNRQVSAITAQFGGVSHHPSSIISNERVSEKMQSDARIYKGQYNDYE